MRKTQQIRFGRWTGLITFAMMSAFPLYALNYDAALQKARAGDYASALKSFRTLYAHHPHNRKLLYDYITVLGWAGRDLDAIALGAKVDPEKAPDYLLQSLAKSERNVKAYEQAVSDYIIGARRFPNDPQFMIGLANTLTDLNKHELARAVLQRAQSRFAKNPSALFAIAKAYEQRRDYFDAMRIYQQLDRVPKWHDKAILSLVPVLRRLGMPFVAQRYIRKNPHLFSEKTPLPIALTSDEAAFRLRWFSHGYHREGNRTEGIEALHTIEKIIRTLRARHADIHDPHLKNALFDRIVALHVLHKEKEAIRAYRTLERRGIAMPPYVLKAAGESFLAMKQPEKAQRLFKKALKRAPSDFSLRQDLFYAYSDAYQMHDALSYARRLDRAEPTKIWDRNHLHKIPNPRKENSVMLLALAKAYSGYLPEAIEEIKSLTDRAPMNVWYREELAKQYYYDGLYEEAQKEYDRLLAYHQDTFEALAGKMRIALARHRYEEAKRLLERLRRSYAYRTLDLEKLTKAYDNALKGSFDLQSTYNHGSENGLGQNSNGYRLRATLYTPVLKNYWRLFASGDLLHSRFDQNSLNNTRYAIGATYSDATLDAEVKIAQNAAPLRSAAPSLSLEWHPDDHWRLGAAYARFWEETPDRAILYGIRADHTAVTLAYRQDLFRSFRLQLAHTRFDDGNTARSADLSAQTRLVYGPYYTLDGTLYAGGSTNSKTERVYYAPQRDLYATLALTNTWTLYSLYERRILQKITIEIGTHAEKGYPSQTTGALELAQQWQWSDLLGFDFGFRRSRASYDGAIEYDNSYFFNLNGSF